MVLILAYALLNGDLRLDISFKKTNSLFLALLVYVVVVNFALFLGTLGEKTKGLPWYIVSAFYVYNYAVFRLVLGLYSRYHHLFFKATALGVLFGVVLTVGIGPFMTEYNDIRGSLTFQTSNQLGYYSLITAAFLFLVPKVVNMSRLIIFLAIFACFYMAAVSLSNAAIFSIVILFGIYLVERGVFRLQTILSIAFVGMMGILALLSTEFGQSTIARYQYRVDTSVRAQAGVSEWEYRGYDRMTNHPYYLILGAGEGAYNRFDTFIDDHEMHSSFGTILFCYGIPGFTIFVLLVLSLFKGLKLGVVLYAAPIFAYGLTHMGLRFTVFWIALALFPILNHYSRLYWSSRTSQSLKNKYSNLS